MDKLLETLAEILEEDKVAPDDVLEDFDEWDSLSALSVVAAIDTEFSVMVTSDELADAETVKDLLDLVGSKL